MRPFSYHMAAWEWRILKVYFECVDWLFCLWLVKGLTQGLQVQPSMRMFLGAVHLPQSPQTCWLYLALFWVSTFVKLPSISHESEAENGGVLLIWGKGVGVFCRISLQSWRGVVPLSEIRRKVAGLRGLLVEIVTVGSCVSDVSVVSMMDSSEQGSVLYEIKSARWCGE